MILDGGQVGIGVESTIVDVSGPVPTLLRPGAVTLEMLRETLGQVEVDPAILGPVKGDVKPKAPGMKYRHYAPKADMVLVEGAMEDVVDYINREAAKAMGSRKESGDHLYQGEQGPVSPGTSGGHRQQEPGGDGGPQPVRGAAGFR